MTIVLVKHDIGCKWSRATDVDIDSSGKVLSANIGPGHTDAAKRFCDAYNLHKAAGTRQGWIAVRLSDGSSDGVVYDTRLDAIADCFPDERWYFYAQLDAPPLTVCKAESLLRYKRIMNQVEGPHTDRDAPRGGLQVIPRLQMEDVEAQIRAVRTGQGALAMGYRE